MSKTELLLSKLRNISVIVSIGAFAFFVIDLLMAVVFGAIDCDDSGWPCEIGPEHFGFKSTLWILLVFFVVFLVLGRVLDFLLQKESKLVDVNSYRESLVRQEEVSFSQTKIYSDILKTKKARYTDMANGGEDEDELEDEFTEVPESNLRDKINAAKLPFFARKKLEESNKVVEVAKVDEIEEAEEQDTPEEVIQTEPKETFMDKVKDSMGKVKDKVQSVEWKFWEKEKSETDAKEDEDQEPKVSFMEKVKSVNWMFWTKEKTSKSSEFDDELLEEDEKVARPKKSAKSKGSKVAIISDKEKTEETETIDESVKEKEFYTRLNKGELIEIVAKATQLSKAKARLAINTTLNIITEQVKNEDEVKIGKFGRFKKIEVKEGMGVHPTTGKPMKIQAGFTVKFYPDKVFKEMILDDVDHTAGKSLLTKTAMKKMSETAVEEELYKEAKIHEHVELKVVKEKEFLKEESVVKEEPVVVKEEPKKEPKKEPAPKVEPKVEEKAPIPVAKTIEKPKPAVAKKPKKVSVVTKTKADLIEFIFETTEISKNKSNKFLGTFGKVITEELAKGGEVELKGLGVITTIVMPAKDAVNPQTKEKITVPEHRQVRMRFSEDYKKKFE